MITIKSKIIVLFLIMLFCSTALALTTNTTTPSSGVYNETFELGTGNTTANGAYINGDWKTGWRLGTTSTTGTYIDINSVLTHTGNKSLFMKATNILTNGFVYVGQTPYPGSTLNGASLTSAILVKPNTKYKVSAWFYIIDSNDAIKMDVGITPYSISGSRLGGTNSDVVSVTTLGSWQKASKFFVTASNSYYATVTCVASNGAGTNGYVLAHCDDVRSEEVDTVNLSGQSQGRPSIVVTGVSDFNAIDQADTNNTGSATFGTPTIQAKAQCFTPTQNDNKFVFQRFTSTGTFTGDIIVSLRDGNQNSSTAIPKGTPLISYTIPNATWEAIPHTTDSYVSLNYITDANSSKVYCIDFNSTTYDVNNHPNLRVDSTTNGSYSSGQSLYFNGTTWASNNTDIYFKTMFEKQSSAFDLNVCSSGDTICDSKTYDINLTNGSTYTITPANAPLFYSGDNNVYYMQHSDSLFENKTPSMMGNLAFTFDAPTTTSNIVRNAIQTEVILACTPGITGSCYTTAYSYNGINYFTYTTPLILNNEAHELYYYSNDTVENYETPVHITIPAPSIPQITSNSCSLVLDGMNTMIEGLVAAVVLIILAIGFGAIFLATRPNGSGYEVKDNTSIIKVGAIVASLVTLGLAIAIVLVMIINLCH